MTILISSYHGNAARDPFFTAVAAACSPLLAAENIDGEDLICVNIGKANVRLLRDR